jgi:hypothetical protein
VKQLLVGLVSVVLFSLPAWAQPSDQQGDVAFAVGSLFTPSASNASGNYSAQSMGGGAYLTFSGDFLFYRHFGIGSEVSWRASRNNYGGYQPYRPIFYDVNAVYSPPLGKHAQVELLGGMGGVSTHFYSQYYACNYFVCSNYSSVNHFDGDVGAGIKLFLHGGVFLRPEFREYFIKHNYEFSSGHATRADVALGYTFGR